MKADRLCFQVCHECLVAVSLREQENVFGKHFVTRVFLPLEFFVLYSIKREADVVRMERNGSRIKLKLANQLLAGTDSSVAVWCSA